VYMTSKPTTDVPIIFLEDPGGAPRNMTAALLTSVGSYNCDDYNAYNVTGFGTTDIGKWHQVACTFNGATGKMTAYFDGKQVGSSVLASINSPFNQINIAAGDAASYWWPSAPTFNGFIDDAAIYTSALSDSQIDSIYASGLAAHPNIAQNSPR